MGGCGFFIYSVYAIFNQCMYLRRMGCFSVLVVFLGFYMLSFLCIFHGVNLMGLWLFEVLM